MLFIVLKILFLACLLTVNGTEPFRQFKRMEGVRFSHVQRSIRSLAAGKSGCAVTCLQTADCDAFHCTANSSASFNCELLITSATDYAALTPAADWSIYSSHTLLTTSGMATFCCIIENVSRIYTVLRHCRNVKTKNFFTELLTSTICD